MLTTWCGCRLAVFFPVSRPGTMVLSARFLLDASIQFTSRIVHQLSKKACGGLRANGSWSAPPHTHSNASPNLLLDATPQPLPTPALTSAQTTNGLADATLAGASAVWQGRHKTRCCSTSSWAWARGSSTAHPPRHLGSGDPPLVFQRLGCPLVTLVVPPRSLSWAVAGCSFSPRFFLTCPLRIPKDAPYESGERETRRGRKKGRRSDSCSVVGSKFQNSSSRSSTIRAARA